MLYVLAVTARAVAVGTWAVVRVVVVRPVVLVVQVVAGALFLLLILGLVIEAAR